MKKNSSKRRLWKKPFFSGWEKGFTLMEMLVAVGILVVLLAVAIPGVAALQRSLEMQELDDTARQIFLSAQAELVEMKSSGALEIFEKDMISGYTAQSLKALSNGKPSDYDGEDSDWEGLFYLNSTDAILIQNLIGEHSVLASYLEGGSFVLELNPSSGDVYGVFYAKRPDLSYKDEISSLPDRGRASRQDKKVGYYGGQGGISASASLPDDFNPNLEVINGEDLYLKLTCSGLQAVRATQRYLTLTILVEGEDSGSWTKQYQGGTSDFKVRAMGDTTVYVLLDSLRDDSHFSEITEGRLPSGGNLKITATLDYTKGAVNRSGTASATTNSLFAERKTENGVTEISLGTLRHLNNLRQNYFWDIPSGKTSIVQIKDISFDVEKWDKETIWPKAEKENPLTQFQAIINFLLMPIYGTGERVSFDGRGHILEGIPFYTAFTGSTENSVGLFGYADEMTFRGIRLVNCSVTGTNNMGAGLLVGRMRGGSITDCQAYLTNGDALGRFWEDMDERLAKYAVKVPNGNSIGGLVGYTFEPVSIVDSFAAVSVIGSSGVGGLVGNFERGTIENCYASGSIKAKSDAGGLLGSNNMGTEVSNCYATSDVTADTGAGGFVGVSTGKFVDKRTTFTDCESYGRVSKADGSNAANSGAFVGRYTDINNIYINCRYLQQGDYNANYKHPVNYAKATGFGLLKVEGNLRDNSHPYDRALFGNAFPFRMLTGKDGQPIPHRGNWMAELKLQTSLVYYERYADGTYGYYAKTSLTTAEGSGAAGGANIWTLDTLRYDSGTYCVEDGYAIMTIFKLSKFNYQLGDNPEKTVTTVGNIGMAGEGKAPLITDKVSLLFRKADLTYTISDARVYQLPFNLQVAERSADEKFFLKLKITGFRDIDTGSEEVFSDYEFYYCPDFAKNAVNPNPNQATGGVPLDPGGKENPVYVRSPRQLNGLSRYIYYWNEGNNLGQKFYFKQEIDLNYSSYTKKYCGVVYDLMDTSEKNPYRNRPIGRPTHETGSQFRNIYDGMGNRIIDFCCTTYDADKYQFTGLFGEVRMCTLKNIHMVASQPGASGARSSGYVESQYNDAYQGERPPGTGALVGLVYVDINDTYDAEIARVENCSASGYDVISRPLGSMAKSSAVGGLVGQNFGVVTNCSAVSKVVLSQQNGSGTRFVGGLAGSVEGKGEIRNCYAGGNLQVSSSGTASVGGLVGGFQNLYGYADTRPDARAQLIRNCYSYCTWEKGNLPVGSFAAVAPQVDKFTISDCYYLADTVEDGVVFSSSSRGVKKNFTELKTLNLPGFGFAATENSHPWSDGLTKAYPFPAVVKSATDKNEGGGGAYVHYGDWFELNTTKASALLTYYERYADNSWGYSYVDAKGMLTNKNLKGNEAVITQAGYGVLVLKGAALPTINEESAEVETMAAATLSIREGDYELRRFTAAALSGKLNPGDEKSCAIRVGYMETDDAGSRAVSRQRYLNVNFAAALSATALPATAANPLQVRTAEQLANVVAEKTGVGWYLKLTHSIVATASTGLLTNDGFTFDGGYVPGGAKQLYKSGDASYTAGENGNYIVGLRKPLFAQISSGVVSNVALLQVNVSDSASAAALAQQNRGTVVNCFAQGTVTSSGNDAAGLILQNSGTMSQSYFNGTVAAKNFASGLVNNNDAGSIADCYVIGLVKSSNGVASGFLYRNLNGTAENCYTLATVSGTTGLGFGLGGSSASGTTTNCVWVKDTALNQGLSGSGTAKTLREIAAMKLGSAWRAGNEDWSYPLSEKLESFPYQCLAALDVYGDWPVLKKTGRLGVGILWTYGNGPNREETVNGAYYDMQTGTSAKISKPNYYTSRRKEVILLLPQGDNPSDYTIWYDGMNYTRLNVRTGLENLPDGVTAYSLVGAEGEENATLTLTDRRDNSSCRFESDRNANTFDWVSYKN